MMQSLVRKRTLSQGVIQLDLTHTQAQLLRRLLGRHMTGQSKERRSLDEVFYALETSTQSGDKLDFIKA